VGASGLNDGRDKDFTSVWFNMRSS
jgi:hypothetical protein